MRFPVLRNLLVKLFLFRNSPFFYFYSDITESHQCFSPRESNAGHATAPPESATTILLRLAPACSLACRSTPLKECTTACIQERRYLITRCTVVNVAAYRLSEVYGWTDDCHQANNPTLTLTAVPRAGLGWPRNTAALQIHTKVRYLRVGGPDRDLTAIPAVRQDGEVGEGPVDGAVDIVVALRESNAFSCTATPGLAWTSSPARRSVHGEKPCLGTQGCLFALVRHHQEQHYRRLDGVGELSCV